MNININIGNDGQLAEKHHFETRESAQAFLTERVPSLTSEQLHEIMYHPETQFQVPGMINADYDNCAYWGAIRYEITVESF